MERGPLDGRPTTPPPAYGAVGSFHAAGPPAEIPPAYSPSTGLDIWAGPRAPSTLGHRALGVATALPKILLTPVAGATFGLLCPIYGLYKTNLLEVGRPIHSGTDLGYNVLVAAALGCTFLPVAAVAGGVVGLIGGTWVGVQSALQNSSPLDFVALFEDRGNNG